MFLPVERPRKSRYWRRTYIRNDGTTVHGHWVNNPDSGGSTPSTPPPFSPSPPPPSTPPSPPPVSAPSAPHPRKKRRRVAFGITAAVTVTAGAATFTATRGGSSSPNDNVSVQVNIDLSQAVTKLPKLGFAGSASTKSGGSNSSADCSRSATGEVRQFLTRNPCKEYAVTSIKTHRQQIATQAVITWVVMDTPTLATQYKDIVDQRYKGNPPGQPTSFNGLCYASGQSSDTAWVAQVQPTGHVAVDRQILRAVAPVELSTNYLGIHCVR